MHETRIAHHRRPRRILNIKVSTSDVLSANICSSFLWVDKYKPATRQDLIVHKKKVDEIACWLKQTRKKCGILLLSGPTGCGKTAAINVLSHELAFQVIEWINSVSLDDDVSRNNASYHRLNIDGLLPTSQIKQFADFLLRADRYNKLPLSGLCDQSTLLDKNNLNASQIVVVEDFPNVFYRDPTQLHNILRCYVNLANSAHRMHPLVLITNEERISNKTKSHHNTYGGQYVQLFPENIISSLGIHCISMNPVASTAMKATLRQIVERESAHYCTINSKTISCVVDRVEQCCSGDIRAAVNCLQFELQSNWLCSAVGFESSDRGADKQLGLFRALGKVLYAKRDSSANVALCAQLPDWLQIEHKASPLAFDVEQAVDQSGLAADSFAMYLHENYLDFFLNFDDLLSVSQCFSEADCCSVGSQNWQANQLAKNYTASICARGLAHHNSQPSSAAWRPLRKPAYYSAMENQFVTQLKVKNALSPMLLCWHDLSVEWAPFLYQLLEAGYSLEGCCADSALKLLHSHKCAFSGAQTKLLPVRFNSSSILRLHAVPQAEQPKDCHVVIESFSDDDDAW